MQYVVKFDSTNNSDTIFVGEPNKNFVSPGSYYKTITADQNYFPDCCIHKSCQSCGGTGIRKDGLGACIHMISCPCPFCTVNC